MKKILTIAITLLTIFIFITCSDSSSSSTTADNICTFRSLNATFGLVESAVTNTGTCEVIGEEIIFTNNSVNNAISVRINKDFNLFINRGAVGGTEFNGIVKVTNNGRRWQWQSEDIAQGNYTENIISFAGVNNNLGNVSNLPCTWRELKIESEGSSSTTTRNNTTPGTCTIAGDTITWTDENNSSRTRQINSSGIEYISDEGTGPSTPTVGSRVVIFSDGRRWEWWDGAGGTIVIRDANIIEID